MSISNKKVLDGSIDLGTSETRLMTSNGLNYFAIPNVIKEIEKEPVIGDMENGDPLSDLRLEVHSPILSKPRKLMVGKAAARRANADERSLDVEKYENEQTYIMLLVAVALQAAFSVHPEKKEINIDYIGSSVLPMNEATDEAKKRAFVDNLINNEHSIVFLETPQLRGITVNINFVNFMVNPEGKIAFLRLSELKRKELGGGFVDWKNQKIGIADCGDYSTDVSGFNRGVVEPAWCEFYTYGAGNVLDQLLKWIRSESRIKRDYKSRLELHDILFHTDEAKRYIIRKGNRTENAKPVLDKIASDYAKNYMKVLDSQFNQADYDEFYLVGGAASFMKPYIVKHNKGEGAQGDYPIYFMPTSESRLMILRGANTVLQLYKRKLALLDTPNIAPRYSQYLQRIS